MTARVFAVLAALFLVVAVAIASLTSPGLTLGQAILMLDKTVPVWMRAHSPFWMWDWMELPFLVRPLWLMPACLGVICAGIATSFNMVRTSPTWRRRS